MVLTISIVEQTFIGDMKRIVADIAFDSFYPTNGEALTPADLGMYAIDFLNASPKLGYMFEYDYTNEKLKAYMPFKTHTPAGTNNGPAFTGSELATHQHDAITAGTPAGTNDTPAFTGSELATHQHAAITAGVAVNSVTTAESLTVTSDVGTLAAVPAAVLAIHGTVSAASTVFTIVAAARTLATGEVHVNYTNGEITFYASDDPTAVTVDYVPKTSATNMATHQHAAITAGTPAGSIAAPVFTGSELATHQHDAITAGTPAGSVAAPALTGTEITQSEGEEVDNTDDLSGITGVRIIADGR